MPNLLIVAEPGNGKSTLVTRHAALHKPTISEDGDTTLHPVLLIRAPQGASELGFYERILHALKAPFRARHRVDLVARQVYNLLIAVKTRTLIIDEFHHVLDGPLKKQGHFLTVIKELHNELPISIIGAGTRDAYQALKSDRQLESRFRPIELPGWQIDEDFIALLESFKKTWELDFDSEALAPKILAKAGNTIGEISWLLENAAITCANQAVGK